MRCVSLNSLGAHVDIVACSSSVVFIAEPFFACLADRLDFRCFPFAGYAPQPMMPQHSALQPAVAAVVPQPQVESESQSAIRFRPELPNANEIAPICACCTWDLFSLFLSKTCLCRAFCVCGRRNRIIVRYMRSSHIYVGLTLLLRRQESSFYVFSWSITSDIWQLFSTRPSLYHGNVSFRLEVEVKLELNFEASIFACRHFDAAHIFGFQT